MITQLKVIRLPAVLEMTGLSRSSIYNQISDGGFPRPVRLGARAVGWLHTEVAAWIEERAKKRPAPVECKV